MSPDAPAGREPRRRELERRIVSTLLAIYLGGVCGAFGSGDFHWEWGLLDPLGLFGVMMGAIITPIANWVMLGGLIGCIACCARRVPRWTYVLIAAWSASLVFMVRLAWRS